MGLHAFLRPVVCPLAVTGLGFADPSSRIIGVTCGWGRLCLRGAVVSRQAALKTDSTAVPTAARPAYRLCLPGVLAAGLTWS